jgi:RsiW-degrading membrane proteinase PrsW (M82 family)
MEIPLYWEGFLFGALSEEVIKGILLYFFAMTAQFWDEPIDTFIYAATLALGFAGIENMAFVTSQLDALGGGAGFAVEGTIMLRSVTALVIHLISTFFFAYGLVLFKYQLRGLGRYVVLFLGIIASIGFHGGYNQALYLSSDWNISFLPWFYGIVIIPSMGVVWWLILQLQKISREGKTFKKPVHEINAS